jgi:hypothetical protein
MKKRERDGAIERVCEYTVGVVPTDQKEAEIKTAPFYVSN